MVLVWVDISERNGIKREEYFFFLFFDIFFSLCGENFEGLVCFFFVFFGFRRESGEVTEARIERVFRDDIIKERCRLIYKGKVY